MARKSRSGAAAGGAEARETAWLVAIYIRLSKENAVDPLRDESQSVSNQRTDILDHIAWLEEKDGGRYTVVGTYIDDGVSGTTDEERDEFMEMLSDIRKGKINCVIVKDLSRSFRNHADQGYYLDDWFPRQGVRFISMYHQPVDTYLDPRSARSIGIPIQGVMNENHCAETSDKVRAVFDAKRRHGDFIGGFAPYGYLKDPENRAAFVVDPAAAEVVRTIFAAFFGGMSLTGIAKQLNDEGVPCPSVYKRETLGLTYRNPSADSVKRPLWSGSSVRTILTNRTYCGDMVQGRWRIKSYKIHVQERVPEDEWFIVPNTHEAIIDRETFARVGRLLGRDARTAPGAQAVYLFSGLLRCADCGRSMVRQTVKGRVYYHCTTYKNRSRDACTKHTIRHDALEAAVLFALRQQIYLAVDYPAAIAAIDSAPRRQSKHRRLDDALAHHRRELAKAERYSKALYEDYRDGVLSRRSYSQLAAEYEEKIGDLERAIRAAETELEELEAGDAGETACLAAYREHGNITALSREVLTELVDAITVHESGDIDIAFTFADHEPSAQRNPPNLPRETAG